MANTQNDLSSSFVSGLKSDEDRTKEWTDAAQFYIDIRRTQEPEPELEKEASTAQRALHTVARMDPTGILTPMIASKTHRIAGLAGGALFGLGTALASRGKKEFGGQSKLEHTLQEEKAKRAKQPEPPSFAGKVRDGFRDLSANLATASRKHPIAAGAVGAIGGAKAGIGLMRLMGKR